MKYRLLLTLLILGVTVFAQKGKKPTLYELKEIYTGKEVIVKTDLIKNGKQYEWNKAKKKGKYYRASIAYIPVKYINQRAEILTIQLASIERKAIVGKTDVFGESIIIDSIVDPYFEVVVKFKDGTKAISTSYASTLKDNIELLNDFEDRKAMIEKIIPEIIGDTLYATANSKLYKSTVSVDEMLSRRAPSILLKFPKLEPIIIERAKFVIPQNIIIIKLKDSNNNYYLAYCDCIKHNLMDKTATEIIASSINMSTEIPSWYTQADIKAIKNGTFFKGMDKYALYDSMGYPDEENTNSYGGDQLIYHNSIYIYLDDKNEKVESWQILDY